jgi:hypothetical protein
MDAPSSVGGGGATDGSSAEDAAAEAKFSAATRAARLECQAGRAQDCVAQLIGLGFRYRLADAVLRYGAEAAGAGTGATSTAGAPAPSALGSLACADEVLPAWALRRLQRSFGSGAEYWQAHGYDERLPSDYFSYAFSLGERASHGVIGAVAGALQRRLAGAFPQLAAARFVEWWAHCRPHAMGHQLHFDSDDEGRGAVRNPICSCVVYLLAEAGGPTLVTNQRGADRKLATHGWLCAPRENRVCAFDGQLLHMVVPGREDGEFLAAHPELADPARRRATLMIAFWKDLNVRTSSSSARVHPLGPAAPQWAKELDRVDEAIDPALGRAAEPQLVRTIWEPLSPAMLHRMPSYDECFQGF